MMWLAGWWGGVCSTLLLTDWVLRRENLVGDELAYFGAIGLASVFWPVYLVIALVTWMRDRWE